MKHKYYGRYMTIYGTVLPGAASINAWSKKVEGLTPEARHKLQICDWHKKNEENISFTARHFGYTRKTIRNWLKRLKKQGPVGLNDQSRRPKKTREPSTPFEVTAKVVKLRKRYPAWSKYKIRAILQKEDIETSASTVGRILKRKNLINKKVSRKRQRAAQHPKKRFPKGFVIKNNGVRIMGSGAFLLVWDMI